MVNQERRDVFESLKKIQMMKEAALRKEQFDKAIAVADENPMLKDVLGTSADGGVTFIAGSGRINCVSLFSFIIFHFLSIAVYTTYRTQTSDYTSSFQSHLHLKDLQSINFLDPLILGGRGGRSSSWSLQASRSSATKDRCSAGMPRRYQLRSST